MHKKLIVEAFEKAKSNELKKGVKSPSNFSLAKAISEYISNESTPIGERRLGDYYKLALEKESSDINISQLAVVNGLCNYLGYTDYEDFITRNKKNSNEFDDKKGGSAGISEFVKNNKIKISISALAVIVIVTGIFFSVDQQRWMSWQEDHYEEVEFDSEKLSIGVLKLYKEERISNFKKITPNCTTNFFNENGSVNLWYGKNQKRELEFFTALGLHPETGKTLDPITKYMIKKYICPDYKY